jgi:hypothetical protein
MGKRILLNSQINDIFKYIDLAGLNHNDFEWLVKKSSISPYWEVPTLIHKPTGYYFKFDIKQGKIVTEYFPNKEGVVYTKIWPIWEPQLNDFMIWLGLLKDELDTPNLWETILNEKRLFGDVPEGYLINEQFNVKEQEYISAKITEIEGFLKEKHDLLERDIEIINTKLNYLEEASKRLGRKDWLNVLIGVSFKIAVDLGLSTNIAKEFFQLIGIAFSQLLSGPVLLP